MQVRGPSDNRHTLRPPMSGLVGFLGANVYAWRVVAIVALTRIKIVWDEMERDGMRWDEMD